VIATLKEVRELALALSDDDRGALAHELLLSLEGAMPAESEEAEFDEPLRTELARRLKDYRDGKAAPIPMAEVFAGIRAELDK
jgi:putative addiction module component (TIGR02574 family)